MTKVEIRFCTQNKNLHQFSEMKNKNLRSFYFAGFQPKKTQLKLWCFLSGLRLLTSFMGKAKNGNRHNEKLKQHKSQTGTAPGTLMPVPCRANTRRASHRINVITTEEIIITRGFILSFNRASPTRNITGKPANCNWCGVTEVWLSKNNSHADGATANAYALPAQGQAVIIATTNQTNGNPKR
ncbi:MAG: hypothetical protein KAJ52_06535 [Sedimentisphaerales bacterium]|nr:hypothetical protein [Sedimentisphaerales bacterium]